MICALKKAWPDDKISPQSNGAVRLTELGGAPPGNAEAEKNADRLGTLSCSLSVPFFIFDGGIQKGALMRKIGIVMGSDSDLPVIQKAVDTLRELAIPFEVHIYSAHRTPEEARAFALNARSAGFGAIIAAAGMAAHLAGAIAANTTLPVIGIPCSSKYLDGIDALLSTVQMPGGIPVATVAIDGGTNAALLAAQILAVEDAALAEKLDHKRKAAAQKVLEKDSEIMNRLG